MEVHNIPIKHIKITTTSVITPPVPSIASKDLAPAINDLVKLIKALPIFFVVPNVVFNVFSVAYLVFIVNFFARSSLFDLFLICLKYVDLISF